MGKTVLHFTTSLDGRIGDADGSLEWAMGYADAVAPEADRVARDAGAVISGRRGYDLDSTSRPYGGGWEGRIFILSHRPPPADAPADYEFLDLPITEAVAHASRACGGRDVLLFSADLARQALDAGIVDEMLLHIVPVVLGEGQRLFDGVETRNRFHTQLAAQSNEVTTLLLTAVRE